MFNKDIKTFAKESFWHSLCAVRPFKSLIEKQSKYNQYTVIQKDNSTAPREMGQVILEKLRQFASTS